MSVGKLLIAIGLLLSACSGFAQPVLLPAPKELILQKGVYKFGSHPEVKYIIDKTLAPEAYVLAVKTTKIEIKSSDKNGRFYAGQTLRLLRFQYSNELPCMVITDAPRLQWRSLLLDSGRQYQDIKTIKKCLDLMAMLKINRLHWHLTEGLGWRVAIRKYPRLTQVGAYIGKQQGEQGFYTTREIREIIEYAGNRGITVMPEIDIPGHAEAALTAYPQFTCFNEPPPFTGSGFTPFIFCAGKDQTITFLKDILDEVMNIFPSEYIHLGGDEAPKDHWQKCPDCQKRIKDKGLKDAHELQLWLSAEMADHLARRGRKAVFWGDVLYSGEYALPPTSLIQWWNWRGHGDLAYRRAAKAGYKVIASTNYYTYLNFPTVPWRNYKADRTFNIRTAYEHNPSFKPDDRDVIIGMNASLWTDNRLTQDMLFERLLPRIFALTEQMWSKAPLVSFDNFYKKVETIEPWFEANGFKFGPAF